MAHVGVLSSTVQPLGAAARGSGMSQTPRMCAGLRRGPVEANRSFGSRAPTPFRVGGGKKTHAVGGAGPATVVTPLRVVCANPRRVAKVQQQMRREISNMLQTDKNIRSMISPEERMGVDNVISVMVTVSDVEVSNDLQVVKVFVSILGDERGKQNAIRGLKKMEGYVRRNIGRKVSLRLTPDIRFVYDDSFERGQKVSNLLDALREEREEREAGGGGYSKAELLAVEDTISNPYDDDDEDDWEGGMEIVGDDDDDDEDDEDIDIEAVWDEMNKDAAGGDDMIDVK